MVALQSLGTWTGAPGTLVCWQPTPATRDAVTAAPFVPTPPSRQQEQHLRAYRHFADTGVPMARLITLAWDEPGQCDLTAMTEAITAHLRRHDTYRSRFSFDDQDRAVRHHLQDPETLAVEPVTVGLRDAAAWRAHVEATPGPLTWDCFTFGVIQREDHFTVFAGIDHVHADVSLVMLLFHELHSTYTALAVGNPVPALPEVGSYLDYCRRQEAALSELTADSPAIRAWSAFLESNGGGLPRLPLGLGDLPDCPTDVVVFPLLDAVASAKFEKACAAVGARTLGGLLACAALAESTLTGATRYAVITPTTTRATPAEQVTSGWFASVVPILLTHTDVPFEQLARAAQSAFDDGLPLAQVPIERVLELAEPPIPPATSVVPMLSYLDTELPPMDPSVIAGWDNHNGRLLLNRGASQQIGLWVTRTPDGMLLSVAYPEDPAERQALDTYTGALIATVARVAEEASG